MRSCLRYNRPARTAALLAWTCGGVLLAQSPQAANPFAPDYSVGAKVFPHITRPYKNRYVPTPLLSNSTAAPLEVHDGKLNLSLAQVVAAVVANNLTLDNARYYPAEAQIDLLRARSGQSPRGVDQASIPSGVFAGAQGSSILGSAGGGGGGASNAGGITGTATAVRVGAAGVFDPSITASVSLDHTISPLNTEIVAGKANVATTTVAASIGYTQAFPSGTSISASYGFQRQASNQLQLLFDPAYTPGITATVTQQLWNGFGYKVNRALIEVAQNEQAIERQSFKQAAIAAVATGENAYWDLISARESVRETQQALTVAQQLMANNTRAYDAGVMARLDVVNAQSQVANSQRDLDIAETNLQYAELNLKTMISKTLDEPLASAEIVTTDSFPDPEGEQIPNLRDAVAIAGKNRPEIAIAAGNIKSQTDVLPFLQNALKPNVNAFFLLNTEGLYNVFGTAIWYDFNFKYPQFAFGLNINFPVHNRQAQADNIRSRLELRQAQDSSTRAKSQVEVDVQTALIGMTQGKFQVSAAHTAVELAQQQTQAERQKLAAGLSTSYNVILVERDLYAARLAEVQARDNYAKAKVALNQAMGTSLDVHHVDLDQAMKSALKSPVQ